MSDKTSESSANYVLLTRLADEVAARFRAGERPALQEYLDRYPELAEDLRELFPAMVEIEQVKEAHQEAAAPTAAPPAPALQQLGDFRILREVGKGGMGVVYEAEQVSLGRHVALKVLPKALLLDARAKRRFEREAKAAAKLHHTNIVPVYGVGEQEGMPYYVMQFIQGLGLDEVLDELKRLPVGAAPSASPPGAPPRVSRPDVSAVAMARSLLTGQFQPAPNATVDEVPDAADEKPAASVPAAPLGQPAEALPRSSASWVLPGQSGSGQQPQAQKPTYWQSVARIGVQVADALEYAHKQRILHRDIKPSNLLLDTQGTVWITDFGLAKVDDQQNLTHTGDILGTLRYMPPEAFEGKSDARSDVYSLGLTLYELLAFRPAFAAKERNQLIKQVTHAEPARLDKLNRQVPQDLETIVHKAIDKDPRQRYASAGALAEDLQRFLSDEPIQARRVSQTERLRRWCRRNPVVAGLTAAVALLLAVLACGGVTAAVIYGRVADQERQARQDTEAKKGELEAKKGELEVSLYFQRIALAHRELTANLPNPGKAEELLDACAPDQRRWEWHYLKRLGRVEPVVLRLRDPGNQEINSVSFSPDGAEVAAACADGTVKVWNAKTGQVVILHGHTGYVFSVAFSPTDVSRVASAGDDRTVRVWDLTTRQEIFQLPGAEGHIYGGAYSVTFSPDGRWLAAASDSGTVRIWDATTGHLLRTLPDHEIRAACVAFSPDGRLLASGSWGGIVRIWDAQTGRCHLTLGGHKHPVGAVAFSPDGQHLAAGYFDRLIEVWDTATGERRHTLDGHIDLVIGLAFSPDSRRLASGSADRTVRLWDPATGQEVLHFRGHTNFCQGVAFRPDGWLLASASRDRTIRFWDATPLTGNEGQELLTFADHTHQVLSVAISPDGTRIASAGLDATVHIWDARTGQVIRTFADITNVVFSMAFSPDGRRLAAVGVDRGGPPPFVLKVWDAQTGEPVLALREPREILATAFSPDGQWLALGLHDGTVKLADARTGQEIDVSGNNKHEVMMGGVTFSPDGRRLASASNDGTVTVWDVTPAYPSPRGLRAWLPVLGLCTQAGCAAPLPLAWVVQLQLASWAETGKPLTLHSESGAGFWSVAFSPDGHRLITGSQDGQLTLWEAETGKQIRAVRGLAGGPYLAVAFSPDGRWVATAGGDCTVRVWDATTLEPIQTFHGHRGPIRCLAVSRDGKFLVTGGSDKTVKVWDLTRLDKKTKE